MRGPPAALDFLPPMSKASNRYTTRVSGLWAPRHTFYDGEEKLGVLSVERSRLGTVVGGEYRPEKGEELRFERSPGLLRSQFFMWTDHREWLGSSLRWSFVRREVTIHSGGRPFRLVPRPGFQRGWSLFAPKTGETARILVPPLGRDAEIEIFRKLDFPLLVFAYFLGSQIYRESLWPGPSAEKAMKQAEQSVL